MSKDDTIRTIVKESSHLYRAADEAQDRIVEVRSKVVVHISDALTLHEDACKNIPINETMDSRGVIRT